MAAPGGFLDSISPWGSRANTPKIGSSDKSQSEHPSPALRPQQGGDHHTSNRHRISSKEVPEDCPPLNVRWFYAVDVPKRKPEAITKPSEKGKPLGRPKKYASFSARDSRSLENAFQKLAEQEEKLGTSKDHAIDITDSGREGEDIGDFGSHGNTSIDNAKDQERGGAVKVPVNEDYLFDVDIDTRELAPAYWLGPIYDVRRATWFYQDSSSSRPCDENLAFQLEEGYLKAKPWRYEPPPTKSRPASWVYGDSALKSVGTGRKASRDRSADDSENQKQEGSLLAAESASPKFQLQTHRLFGAYMNSVVTYQDSTVAWLLTDDFLSRMSSTVYQRFAGGGHLGGIKVVRGFAEPSKAKEDKGDGTVQAQTSDDRGRQGDAKRQSTQSTANNDSHEGTESPLDNLPESESQRSALERRMKTIVGSPGPEDDAAQEEEVRRREEKEIEQDYRGADGDTPDREIEHLVLITHGIGQRLGLKLESLNFIHDVNVLRKTLKTVYEGSPDLQALNSEVDKLPKNCRIQVLPVVWRHLLDFPKQSFKDNMEKDLGDADPMGEMEYPKLSDITVEGVPAIRNLIEDLFLDILLYQSGYREHIARIVQQESNRVYKMFRDRNPKFNGKVSLIGHSLGSAIYFDLLCRQRDSEHDTRGQMKPPPSRSARRISNADSRVLALDFEVEDLYCLGSPIGLFQMLKGKNISGRPENQNVTAPDGSMGSNPLQSTLLQTPSTGPATDFLEHGTTSSPKCKQLYNLFHPTDPIAYRLEPLITPAMKDLKPQPLPYVKKGLFGAPVQGLSGIGTRVGQSVSDFWSNITTGVASSLLNRSLGLQAVDPSEQTQQRVHSLSIGAGTNISGGVIAGPEELEATRRKASNSISSNTEGTLEHPPTLIDQEIQTLYSGFQKSRKVAQSDESRDLGHSAEWVEAEARAKRYRREEAKVRALNSNGRVDYSIQEGAFDISLIGSIASHLSYWSDEDVNHFMISQLLARQRVVKR